MIGTFIILSEGSVAAGVRRIEAITGREAQWVVEKNRALVARLSRELEVGADKLETRVHALIEERDQLAKQVTSMRSLTAMSAYRALQPSTVRGIPYLTAHFEDADPETLRILTDQFREDHPKGVAVFSTSSEDKPLIIAAIGEDLIGRGFHAGDLVKEVAKFVGGGGGGKPHLAQAGGKDLSRLEEALDSVSDWIEKHLE